MSDSSTASVPEGRRQSGKRRRREQIAQAAAELLQARSFDDVTTREVAEHAGVGEATLFRYIGSKEDLLAIVYGEQFDLVLDATEEGDERASEKIARSRTVRAEQFIERMLAVYRARCEFYLKNPLNATRYLREGFEASEQGREKHIEQGNRSMLLTTRILTDGQQAGVITTAVDAAIVAQNCHGIYIHEIERTPVRGLSPKTIWQRLEPRLRAQLEPLGQRPS